MSCGRAHRCLTPRRCCISCQRCTSGDSGWRRCSTSCPGSGAARSVQRSGADRRSRQSCTICLKTWLGETHKAVVTLILLMNLELYDHKNTMETIWKAFIYCFIRPSPLMSNSSWIVSINIVWTFCVLFYKLWPTVEIYPATAVVPGSKRWDLLTTTFSENPDWTICPLPTPVVMHSSKQRAQDCSALHLNAHSRCLHLNTVFLLCSKGLATEVAIWWRCQRCLFVF